MGAPAGGNRELVASFSVPGEPVSKARARFTGYGSKVRAYTPARTLTAEASIAAAFTQAGGEFDPSTETTFAVDATFFNGTRQRRDVDNMLKLILDGLNGTAWVDDNQVMDVVARKRFTARAEARTDVAIYRLERPFDRLTKPCEHCGEAFVTYESLKDKTRFCSSTCGEDARVAARKRTCEQCGGSFLAHAPSTGTRFCSRACRAENGSVTIPCKMCGTEFRQYRSWVTQRPYCSADCVQENARARARRTKAFPGRCLICSAGTTRKEYRRCNPCKLAGKTVPAP